MLRKWVSLVQVAAIVGMAVMLSFGLFVASAQGSGPGTASAPPSGTVTAAVGSRAWYVFNYTGDKSEILIRMSVSPSLSAGFGVWTQDAVKTWQSNGTQNPVGRGSVNNALGGDLVWAGNFTIAGTYWVVVDQTGPNPAYYTLSITGTGVSFPAPAPAATVQGTAAVSATKTEVTEEATEMAPTAAAVASGTPAATAVMTAAATSAPAATVVATAPAVTGGTSPETALPIRGASATLQVGGRTWYSFQYTGDKSEILIRMSVSPNMSAVFGVWTSDAVKTWQSNGTENPVGRGSVNNNLGGDFVWAGNFTIPGTYYVVVDQMGPNVANYTLTITGTGVSG